MPRTREKTGETKAAIRIKGEYSAIEAAHVTDVRISRDVQVALEDGHLIFYVVGRQVRIGPLSAEHASLLSDDLLDVAAE